MNNKKYKILPSSVSIVALSLLFLGKTFSIVQTNESLSVGPAAFPRIACIALIFLALLDQFKCIKKNEITGNIKFDKLSTIKLILSMFVFWFCSFTLKILGFPVVGVIFLCSQIILASTSFNKKDLLKILLISIIFTILTFLVFNYGFQLRIPIGILSN